MAIVAGLPAKSFLLARGASVAGRSPGVSVVLPDAEISRQHCRFEWDGQICCVDDLGSIRGTTVNAHRIEGRTELKPGDRIGIGPATLEFGLGEPPPAGADSKEQPPATPVLVHGEASDRIVITGELIVGRDPQAEVILNHASVSRRHAALRLEEGACTVTDLQSTSGSFINGRRFDTHALTVGDRLQIGPFSFEFDGQALVHMGAPRGSSLAADEVTRLVGEKVLLDGISFKIEPSQFTGILGPSGAGKSTLLHALAGLEKPDAGQITADGQDVYADGPRRSFGYVPQEDIVHRELTVSQALTFGARLRLPQATPEGEVQRLVAQTLEQLGLSEQSGAPIRRLSGGQRKRVSVAVELLAKPAVLFLDEPSSGLDPATEFHLMELLRELADTGCTVLCTTHIVENAYLMDDFLVLMGGCLAFQGDAQAARSYFGVSKLVLLYDRLAEMPPHHWKEQFLNRSSPTAQQPVSGPAPEGGGPLRTLAPTRWALPILLQRQWAILAADWRNFAILLGQPLIIAALVSWATTDQVLALFFAYIATLWFGCSNAAQELVKESAIFRRERLVGVGTHAYLLSKYVFLFGLTAAQGLLLLACVQAVFRGTDGQGMLQFLAILGIALSAVGLGCAISSFARSVLQAVLIVPLVLIPQILFSGFTVPASQMTPAVHVVAQLMPTFAAQTLVDSSFILDKRMTGDALTLYGTSLSNLNRDHSTKPGDLFVNRAPAHRALATDLWWAAAMYALAWLGLRRKGHE